MLQAQAANGDELPASSEQATTEAATRRLAEGLPLLSVAELDMEPGSLRDALARVVATFAEYPDLVGELPHGLADLEIGPSLHLEIVHAWFEKRQLPLELRPATVEEELTWEALIHATIKPFLDRKAVAMRRQVKEESWRRGYCPVCGGAPDFSYLDRQNGARRLICSRCDTEWLFQRMQCPFCSNEDQNRLAYFTDDRQMYRLYVCDQCRHYIKAVDLRNAPASANPLVERLLTPDLDRAGADKGYTPWWSGEQRT